MTEPEQQVLLGIPTSPQARQRIGLVKYSPPLGAHLGTCDCCGAEVYLGPRQIAARLANPDIKVGCAVCLSLAMKDGGMPAQVRHLGGHGGIYGLADGRVIGPKTES